jgi:hypothetical protein
MTRRKISRLIPVGLLMMSSALLYHNWMHGRGSDFAVGMLMGISIAMMIVGLVKHNRSSS